MAINKQTGLSITKSGNVLTMTWKLADFYESQETYWSIDGNKVITTLSSSATTTSYTIPVANFFPATSKKLGSITIYVRGKIGTKYGSWASCTYKFVKPNKPVVGKNGLKFLWDTDLNYITGKGDPNVIDVEYQRVNSTSGTQNKVKWGTDASSSDFADSTGNAASGEVSFTETTKIEWFRCCARGLNGQSDWVYTYHVNAAPYAPTNVSASIKNTNVTLSWKTEITAEHPVDYQYIQYCYAKPTSETTKGVPICPSSPTWVTIVNNIVSTAKKQAFDLTQYPGNDKCLFVRVCAVCESYTSVSDPVFVLGGKLVAPSLVSIVSDITTKTSVVTFTDNSTCTLSKMAIITSNNKVLTTVAHGTTTATVKFIPSDKELLGLRAFQGSSATKPNMRSDDVFSTTGDIPLAPTSVSAVATEKSGVAQVSWDIPWTDATGAEVSWANHDDAWESTDGPKSYDINERATQWNVAGLVSGEVYWFRVRLVDTAGVYSPYSATVSLSYASAPGKPTLTSSAVAVQPGEAFQLTWTYETTDTTEQALAIIYDNGVELARVENNSQRMSITPAWLYGTSHSLTVQTTSASGYVSVMSDPVVITVAAAPTISPISSAITSGITDGVLTEMPIVMTVTGAGDGGQTIIKIERLKDFFVERPDGSVTEGYDGETIYAVSYSGDNELTIYPDDLVGSFDDGGEYRLTATVQDSIGQKASSFLDFVVNWSHQAAKPTGTVVINADLSAKVTATAPSSYVSGDTVDIYRLSADKPELIVKGGTFGNNYIDPYPASNGGYRFVDVTANGDYSNDTGLAWVDVTHDLVLPEAIIDFNDNQLMLPYNLSLSNTWKKDFTETQYLNGHVVGDWNAAVSRTGSINTVLLEDDARVLMVRELSTYTGVCHVRTPDGSSFNADVQVTETSTFDSRVRTFVLTMTKVDPEGFEGVDEDNY